MKKPTHPARLGGLLLLPCLGIAPIAQADNEAFAHCAKQYPGNDVERLKCYDRVLEASSAPAANVSLSDDEEMPVPAPVRSYLTRSWNLDDRTVHDQSKLGRLTPHRQSYLVVRSTDRTNNLPASPAPGHSATAPYGFEALETKFQLSFKVDIGSQRDIDLFGLKTLRLWGAYTQQSSWQTFNANNSAMFRETNYEPELIATFGTGNSSGLKLVNLGLSHQSNGQHLPESRSWNRFYMQGGWEWGNTSVLARGWWRIPESAANDENPDIADYAGRADLVARWEPEDKSQAVSVLLRNNLRAPTNRSFMQVDWSLPVALGSAARLHAQLTSGFGESLIDYNHRQTTLGFGISFREW